MSCDRRCFDKKDKFYGHEECLTCPGKDGAPGRIMAKKKRWADMSKQERISEMIDEDRDIWRRLKHKPLESADNHRVM